MLEEDKIKKITAVLEKGGTMLASHHECGAPLFRYHGKIMCPVCDFKEEKKEEKKEIKVEVKEVPRQIKAETLQVSYQKINEAVMKKIQNIAESLESETDIQRVKDKLAGIEQGIKILKLLSD